MGLYEELKTRISQKQDFKILWEWLLQSQCRSFLLQMDSIMQKPEFHGEGSVYEHTRLVCKALMELDEFTELSVSEQTELFLGALLHDIGKIGTTVLEDGKWTSPHHASVGSRMAHEFLWSICGFCGTEEKINIRETVCALIRYHMFPVHMIERINGELLIRQVASVGELAAGFSWQKLCILSYADMQGRIASDIEECLEKVDLCRLMATEAGCFENPYPYTDDCVRYAYLSGRNVMPDQTLYDDTWGEIILLSGLPGTGKDTWISQHLPGVPMISLDDIRREMKVKPTEDQGVIIQAAREKAKEYLRKKEPFVWNATNLSKDIRRKQIRLFEQYGARVLVIYLETDEKIRRGRNASRADVVPEEVIGKLLRKAELPTMCEAQNVEWLCV